MKWPWVSRKRYADAVLACINLSALRESAAGELRKMQYYCKQLEESERNERWRRMVAEGRCSFVEDKVKRSLELMLPFTAEDPPTVKRQAIGDK